VTQPEDAVPAIAAAAGPAAAPRRLKEVVLRGGADRRNTPPRVAEATEDWFAAFHLQRLHELQPWNTIIA